MAGGRNALRFPHFAFNLASKEAIMRNLLVFLVLVICSLILTASAPAQEQTGSIEGVVRDQQGGVLPGSTVEARHLQIGSTITLTSDLAGTFRFTALAPGYYDVTASLSGFQAAKSEHVEVLLGQIKRLEFSLPVAGITEQIEVVATASPLIDVKQNTRGFSLRQDQIDKLPRGLDYTSVVPLMPGANSEPKLGGLSLDGSSAGENRFVIDGMDTTGLTTGVPGQALNIDAVDEIQVKSSGYAAEHGGSTGGVVNVLTRSGTNEWHGDARFYFSSSGLTADPRPTLRRNPQDSTKAEYVTYGEDPFTGPEPGFSLGGPISRNKAWFFASYQPVLRYTERTVTFALDGSTGTFDQQTRRHLLNLNQALQLGSRLHTRVAFNMASGRTDGILPDQAGRETPVGNFSVIRYEPRWSTSGSADYVVSPRVVLSGRVGYFYANERTDNVRSTPRFVFAYSNIGYLDVPPELQRVTGFTTDTSTMDVIRNRDARLSVQADGTWFLNLWGGHSVKAGIQADWMGNDLDRGSKGNSVGLYWGRSLLGKRGKYGYYAITTNSRYPHRGPIYLGKAEGSTAGMFIQDSWTIRRRMTLSLGLRTERESLPGYVVDKEADPIIEFGFGQKLAPRVGIAYDLRGNGRWKLYGSWGVFYDIFKYKLSLAFGAIDAMSYAFTLDTYDWPSLLNDPACPPACPGTLIIGPRRVISSTKDDIDPALKPMRLQEAVAGIEHQLRPSLSLAARYIHKQLDRGVEDIGSLDTDLNEIYTVGNPGYGRATLAFPGVALPRAVRDYDAFEISARRLFSSRWALNTSYVYSRLYGNFSGLSQSDENGRTDPNVGRAYDYPVMMFGQDGKPVYGRLATDRPHQFKIYVLYSAPFGFDLSAFQAAATGVPVTREAAVFPANQYPVQYLGRMSDGRTPPLSQTDIYIQKNFTWSERFKLSLGFSLTNLFNQNTTVSKFSTETDFGRGLAINEDDFYAGRVDFQQLFIQQNETRDPRFLMSDSFQPPRAMRVIVKWMF